MAEIKVELGAMACTRVGVRPITSFTDTSAEAQVISNNYDLIVGNEVDLYDWRFLGKEAKLAAVEIVEDTQSLRWKSAYKLPSDCFGVRTLRTEVGLDIAFERFEDKVLTDRPNNQPVYVEYTRRLPEEAWPAYFRELIVCALTTLVASGVREDAGLTASWEERLTAQRRISRHRDSQMRSTRHIRQSDLVTVRASRASNFDRMRRR